MGEQSSFIEALPNHIDLTLEHNPHRSLYETVEQWSDSDPAVEWTSPAAKARCIELNEVWVLHWYPRTPVGFCRIAGPTLADVLDSARGAGR